MKKAYIYKLKPTKEQRAAISQACGNVRFVYNHMLGRMREEWESKGRRIGFLELSKELTALRRDPSREWLSSSSRATQQQALRHLMLAWGSHVSSLRRRKEGGTGPVVGAPRFKRKNRDEDTARFENGVRVDFSAMTVHLEDVGDVGMLPNRSFPPESRIVAAVVRKDRCGDMWVSVLVEDGCLPPPKAKAKAEDSVGVDLGLKTLATLSDGTSFANPRLLEKCSGKLASLQRAFARTVPGSRHREELRTRIARLHRRIRNCRADSIHKMTSKMTDRYGTIVIEDLDVSGMMSDHGLAGHIQSASWREIRRQLEYKCEWKGRNLITIGRFEPSSKECSVCGHIKDDLSLSDRQWTCPRCGTVHDRDLNAAANILRIGLDNTGARKGGNGEYGVNGDRTERRCGS